MEAPFLFPDPFPSPSFPIPAPFHFLLILLLLLLLHIACVDQDKTKSAALILINKANTVRSKNDAPFGFRYSLTRFSLTWEMIANFATVAAPLLLRHYYWATIIGPLLLGHCYCATVITLLVLGSRFSLSDLLVIVAYGRVLKWLLLFHQRFMDYCVDYCVYSYMCSVGSWLS